MSFPRHTMELPQQPAVIPPAPGSPDVLLRAWLEANDEAESRRHLERVLREVEPIIQGIIRRKWRLPRGNGSGTDPSTVGPSAEDVQGEVFLRLLEWLQDLKTPPDGEHLHNLRGFVAVTTYHVCDSLLRKQFPRRASLKDKLRYLLNGRTGQTGFALWNADSGERLCGFAVWREQRQPPVRSGRSQQLLAAPQAVATTALPHESLAQVNPADLLAALFQWVGGPIELDDLVTVVAELWGIRDEPVRPPAAPGSEPRGGLDERYPDPRTDVASEVEQRLYLQRLWREIRELPPRQGAALLLNLKDDQGCGVLPLLPLQGIATLRQIAAVVGMPAEAFAALWKELPIDDAAIAGLLGSTRQQVINLRKSARARLSRRMQSYDLDKDFS